MSLVIIIHVIVCIALIFFILIQSGRGGGLIESFSSAESIFGTNTNKFLTKATSVLAITFFITCLLLAFLSVRQSRSIVGQQAFQQKKAATDTESQQPIPSAVTTEQQEAATEPLDNAATTQTQQE